MENKKLMELIKMAPVLNNSSYKFYIVASSEAAHLISRGLREAAPRSRDGGQTLSTGYGSVGKDVRIPAMYHKEGLFYAYIEYRNGEDFDFPEFEIVIC